MKIKKITLIKRGVVRTFDATEEIPHDEYNLMAITMDNGEIISW